MTLTLSFGCPTNTRISHCMFFVLVVVLYSKHVSVIGCIWQPLINEYDDDDDEHSSSSGGLAAAATRVIAYGLLRVHGRVHAHIKALRYQQLLLKVLKRRRNESTSN